MHVDLPKNFMVPRVLPALPSSQVGSFTPLDCGFEAHTDTYNSEKKQRGRRRIEKRILPAAYPAIWFPRLGRHLHASPHGGTSPPSETANYASYAVRRRGMHALTPAPPYPRQQIEHSATPFHPPPAAPEPQPQPSATASLPGGTTTPPPSPPSHTHTQTQTPLPSFPASAPQATSPLGPPGRSTSVRSTGMDGLLPSTAVRSGQSLLTAFRPDPDDARGKEHRVKSSQVTSSQAR